MNKLEKVLLTGAICVLFAVVFGLLSTPKPAFAGSPAPCVSGCLTEPCLGTRSGFWGPQECCSGRLVKTCLVDTYITYEQDPTTGACLTGPLNVAGNCHMQYRHANKLDANGRTIPC